MDINLLRFTKEESFLRNYPECNPDNIKCPECLKPMRIISIQKNVENDWIYCSSNEPDKLIVEINISAECYDCNVELDIKKNKVEYEK